MQPEGCRCTEVALEAPIKIVSATGKRGGLEVKSRNIPVITIVASLAALGGMALAAQDKYTVQVPGGLAFSEFRGYEDWRVVAVSQTEDVLKAIVPIPR